MSNFPTPEERHAINEAATFDLGGPSDAGRLYPCVTVGGVQIYVYVHEEEDQEVLRIVGNFDGRDERLLHRDAQGESYVPLEVVIGNDVVFRS
jgi:hypothetical protein